MLSIHEAHQLAEDLYNLATAPNPQILSQTLKTRKQLQALHKTHTLRLIQAMLLKTTSDSDARARGK